MGLRHFLKEAERFGGFADGGFVESEIVECGWVIRMIGEERLENSDFVRGGRGDFFLLLRLRGC